MTAVLLNTCTVSSLLTNAKTAHNRGYSKAEHGVWRPIAADIGIDDVVLQGGHAELVKYFFVALRLRAWY